MTGPTRPGELALVLHTHLPWVAHHGVWPVGEEWLFQVWGHSWLPVTRVLCRLAEEGHRALLTLGVTPMVAAQVADARLRRELGTWLGGQMWRAEEQRWHWWLDERVQALSSHHWQHHAGLAAFHEQVEARGGLLQVWRELAEAGVIELLGGPATHPYLALEPDPALIDAQLACGLDAHTSWAGERPSGAWIPEMSYRPRGPVLDPALGTTDAGVHEGLETHHQRAGLTHVLVDTASVVHLDDHARERALRRGVVVADSDVVAFVRDDVLTARVWGERSAYPSDPWFRDFHVQGTFGAHRSHRVTGLDVALEAKEPYEPDRAAERSAAAAQDFVTATATQLGGGDHAVVALDTELLGHWWYEGPSWLEAVLRSTIDHPRLATTTLSGRLTRARPTARADLAESSWGEGRGHGPWLGPGTEAVWASLRAATSRARSAISHVPAAELTDRTPTGRAAAQLARELAQVQCSDWPWMIAREEGGGYATDRLRGHADAVEELARMLAEGAVDEARVELLRSRTSAPADVSALLAALSSHT